MEDETMEDEDETMEVDEEDRISNLPEEILLNILSFLPTTKDSVRTSLVSKRWISLWKLVPSLAFCHDGNSKAKFTTRVHKTLLYYDRNTDIQSFSLDFDFTVVEEPRYDYERGDYYHDPDDDDDLCDSDIDAWVYTAIKLNVKELELSFYEDEDNRDHDLAYYNLPRSLFRHKLLTKLKLSYCGFSNWHDEIQWISLRSLSIHHADIKDELLQKILRVCAKLECLGLSKCYGIRKIDVVSRNLKELRLGKCGILTKDSDLKAGERVKNSTPNLELLVISRPLYYREFVVEKLHSLVEAWIYPMEFGDGDFRNSKNIVSLTEIVRTVQHAKKLTFGPWCLRDRHVDSLPRSFSNCKSVTLDVNVVYDWFRFRLPNIFEICPQMETFILHLTQKYFFGDTDDKFSRPCNSNTEYHHLPRHLKIVKIYGVTPCLIEEVKHVIGFVRFILKHGTTLEKVSINTHWGHRIPDKETLYKLYEELLNCPRSSPTVVFQLPNDMHLFRYLLTSKSPEN